jgi:4-aminobutyrate aminotransferase-like enzyme
MRRKEQLVTAENIPPCNFYRQLRDVLNAHGILFIADEIQMGFYRIGRLWSSEHFDAKSDIITVSKVVVGQLLQELVPQ